MKGTIVAGFVIAALFVMEGCSKTEEVEEAESTALMPEEHNEPVQLERRAIIRQPTQSSADELATPLPETKEDPVDPEPPLVPPPEKPQESDSQVRKALEDLAAEMVVWLPADTLDKWVLLIDLMANGEVPNKHRPLDFPVAPFKVNSLSVADLANYQRAIPLIDVITAIPPQRLARYYQAWRFELENSFRGLGKPGLFDQRLHVAIDRIIAVRPLVKSASLKRPSVMYKYQDEALEKASALEKFMWRLGRENSVLIQNYLKKLKPLL